MSRKFAYLLLLVGCVGGVVACRETASQTKSTTTPAAPNAAATAAPVTAVTPQVLASPVDPKKPFTLPAEGGKSALEAIPERMRRPMTLEEINALPPETRDMILRAQGRLPAAPATPKK